MVESQGQIPKAALGIDLRAGHLGPQCHRPVKRRLRAKTSVTEPVRGRTNMPEIPGLRALRNDPENMPVSEGSAVSTVS